MRDDEMLGAFYVGKRVDTETDKLTDELVIRARSTDIHVALIGLAWMPYVADEGGRLRPAWS